MATSTITIIKGIPYVRTLTFTDSAGSAYDLTGKTIFFTVKNIDDVADNDTAAVIKKDITVHTNAVGGITTLSLSAVETDIALGDFKYDIKIYQAVPLIDLNSEKGICQVTDKVTERIS